MKGREPFEFVWDLESIRFFWEAQPVRDLGFFTDKRVEAFLRLFRWYGPKAPARVLEIGPGSGMFLACLRELGWRGFAVDVSWDLLSVVRKRGVPGALGAFSALPIRDGGVDALVMLEVVEHLLPGHAEAGLEEAARVLRPGGLLLLSTPHNERLEDHRALCPNCGALFHTVQHVRSFTVAALRSLAEPRGFHTVACLPTNLKTTRLPLDWALRFRAWRRGRKGKADPYLVYIGTRTGPAREIRAASPGAMSTSG
jgi:SAM-dependent methyltransferase